MLIFAGALLLLGIVSWVDYATGASINLLALYFAPLLLAGWYFGIRGVAVFTILATGAWLAVLVAVSDRHRDPLLSRARGAAGVVMLAGLTSIGWMVMVNFIIASDFKWILLSFALLWALAMVLYCLESPGSRGRGAVPTDTSAP